MATWELEDKSRPVTVTTDNGRQVTHYGPMTAEAEAEAVEGTGLKVTIAKKMLKSEGTITYVYRRAQRVTVFGT